MASTQTAMQAITSLKREISRQELTNDIPHFRQIVVIDDVLCPPSIPNVTDSEEVSKASNDDIFSKELRAEIVYLKANASVAYYRHLTSHKSSIQKIVILIKRVIRKLVKFCVEPLVTDQNDLNMHNVRTFELMQRQLELQAQDIALLRKQITP